MKPKNRVLFYYPKMMENQYPLYTPNEVLAVGSVLHSKGYKVDILDQRLIKTDVRDLGDSRDLLFIGISAKIGRQSRDGLEFAKSVNLELPEIPIIWGGWAPTRHPGEFARHPSVDCVIAGDGEDAILQVAEALGSGRDFSRVQGAVYEDTENDGKIIFNPPLPVMDLTRTPMLNYDLVHLDRYMDKSGRALSYQTTRGCGGKCSFCCLNDQYNHKRSIVPRERVIDELAFWIKKYDIKFISFSDSNLFANRNRVLKLAGEFLRRDWKIKWEGTGRADQLNNYSDEHFELLKRSGCQWIYTGLESGSQRILDSIQKRIQLDDCTELVSRLSKADIRLWGHMISGFPDETLTDLSKSIDLALWTKRQNPKNKITFNIFMPRSNDNLIKDIRIGSGRKFKDMELEEMLTVFGNARLRMPWLSQKMERIIKGIYFIYLQPYLDYIEAEGKMDKGNPLAVFKSFIRRRISMYRLDHKYYGFPVLYWLLRIRNRIKPSGHGW
ncbi:MAG: radical SAM protein [candidate division Zixibacteria bacterium]|nr:radical SAM protein [candidate division Zixibacteria bacterium]